MSDPTNWNKLTKEQRDIIVHIQSLSEAFCAEHWDGMTEHQRNGVVRQSLSESFWEKHWTEMTEVQRDGVIWYQPLSESFCKKHWNELTECQRDEVVWHQPLSESFCETHWDEMTEVQRDEVMWRQSLSEAFCAEHWDEMAEVQRDRVVWSQFLTEPFWEAHWDEMTEHQRDLIVHNQILSESFCEAHWAEMTENQRDGIVQYQPIIFDWVTDPELRKLIPVHPTKEEMVDKAKAYAEKHNLEGDESGFWAYRNHDKWGRGFYKNNIYYTTPKEYRDWHCDPRAEIENSYGLGIWPDGNTKVYVKWEDFCVEIEREDGKARVWTFSLMEKS